MRTRILLTLLAALLLAGCSSSPPPAGAPAPTTAAPEPSVDTQDVDFGGPGSSAVDTPAGGLQGHVAFSVPDGVTRMQADAEWDCVSLCPLHILLVTPDGDVGAEGEGGSVTLEVQEPAGGDWDFVWRARDVAAVEPEGTVHFTFESAPAATN